ncbi:MAG: hypothetical protein K9L68_06510 [Spirochaetales bacterium]|nr:hypothetical protein [Spirochaetales bacterium]MCF7938235.1 hypothetical protein [Spirochaetales bacterium]
MKRLCILSLVLFFAATVLFSQENQQGTKFGLQMSSDSRFSLLVYSPFLEAGVNAKALLVDGDGSSAIPAIDVGGHIGYLFRPFQNGSSISLGAEGAYSIGIDDVEYDEYADMGIRVALNYMAGSHFLFSGIFNPLYVNIRDVADTEGDWYMLGNFAEAKVAVAFLF